MTSKNGSGARYSAAAVAAALCLGLGPSPAVATPFPSEIGDVVLEIEASNLLGRGTYQATFEQGIWDSKAHHYRWDLAQPIAIFDVRSGAPVATLLNATLDYLDDPRVNVSFQTQAGPAATSFTITAAQVSFAAISPAMGRASAAITVTDTEGNGALLTGLEPGSGGSYLAQYNGPVPVGTTFAEMIPSVMAFPGSSGAVSANTPGGGGFLPIGATVTDISSRFHFTLSANDLASGTSNWEVVPGPSGVALLVLGAAGLARRRRVNR